MKLSVLKRIVDDAIATHDDIEVVMHVLEDSDYGVYDIEPAKPDDFSVGAAKDCVSSANEPGSGDRIVFVIE